MIYNHDFCFQKYVKLLLQKGQQCCGKDLLFNMHLHEVITEKNNVIMTCELSVSEKACTPKELILKHSKQT